jgi:zinc protease
MEPSLVRPLVERYLASLPSEDGEERWADPGIERPSGVVTDTVEKGIEARSRVSFVFHGDYEWSREENHVLRSMASALETRLREVIREEEGGTYGIGVWASPSRYPDPEYLLHITFGTDPERAENLADRVLAVISEITDEGLESSYARRVRTTQTEEYEKDIETNGYWMSTMQGLYFHELDPTRILEYPELVEAVDAELLTDAARRYLDPDQYIELILYPEDGAPTGR